MSNDLLTSALDAETQIEENSRDGMLNAAIAGTGVGSSAYLLKKYGGADSTLSNFYQKLLGTEFLQRQLNTAPTWVNSGASTFTNQSVMKSFLSQLMAIEEVSPLHVLRTLQLSNILQPFVDITQSDQEILFSERKIRNQKHYYQTLIEFANKDLDKKIRDLKVKKAIEEGMMYKRGKLYGIKDGAIDLNNVLVNQARLTLSNISQGGVNSPNMMFLNYSKSIGASVDLDLMKSDSVTVVGAATRRDLANKWGQGWLRYSLEMGMKSLDNPLGGFEEMLRGAGVDQTSFFESKLWNTAKKYTNIQLGTNGNYDLGIRASLQRSAKNVAIKSTAVALGYEVADSVLRGVSGPDGLFSEGIYTGLTNLYAGTRIKFAEMWSDHFQGYKNSQEEAAAGSTNLMSLMAMPAAGALFGAQMSYFGRIGKTLTSNADEASKVYNVAKESPLLSKFGIDSRLKPMKRNALIGALAGAAVALPFLPGALVGTSSDELRSLYSGEKEVAQKANRWWMFGGSSWEGSHTQYFTKHNVARVNADATDKVRYGDDDTKKKLNPLLHPLSYIRDPYRYEKMHAEDMPYPVWGMDVGYGSIYGKLYERTIGQIIKPDIVNPAVKDLADTVSDAPSLKVGLLQASRNFLLGDKERVGGSVAVPINLDSKDRSMIEEGLMADPPSARYTPNQEGIGLTYQLGVDLIGLKGWTLSMPLAAMGIDPRNAPQQLARSGEATSSARDLVDANLGDMFGFGEFQRKILGTSSGSLPDRLNPLINDMSYWLPSSDNQYYINFKKGNPYDHIKNGEERLPGVGLAALNPELQGVEPDDYSLVYKYKVLSDVAKGSREHIRARQQVLSAYTAGDLSKREVELVKQTLDQEVERDNRKTFYEPATEGKRLGFGPIGYIQSTIWDSVSKHGESHLEMLTPIRPMAKFMHNRTAIEDYIATQLGGSDAGIWTNPYSHFIKPAANKSRLIIDKSFKGEEVVEKENIDEYFDKLDHLRNRRNGTGMQDFNSTVASSMSGLNTKDKVLKFKKSLSDSEKDYFEAFSKETDEKKRNMIRSILPGNVARGYEQIWRNVDIAEKARSQGVSVQQAIAGDIHKQTLKLQDAFGVSLSKEEMDSVKHAVYNNRDSYADMGFSLKDRIQYSADEAVRLKMADMEATTYLRNSTGVPSSKFMGWDPRLKTDDIKIRTLSIGNEDLRRFGFWKKDEERMNRIPALKSEDEVVQSIDRIKASMRENIIMKRQIEMTMFNNGFKASRINVMDANFGNLRIQEDKQ